MLRSVVVREGERLVAIPRLEDERLAQTLAEDLGAREGLRLSLDGDVDGLDVGVVAIDRDEDGLRVETVFLLAEEIRRNEDRVCRLVGDDLRTGNTFRSLGMAKSPRRGRYLREPRTVLREHRSRPWHPSPSPPTTNVLI